MVNVVYDILFAAVIVLLLIVLIWNVRNYINEEHFLLGDLDSDDWNYESDKEEDDEW